VYFGLLIVAGSGLLSWGTERLLARFGPRWGLHAIEDPAGLPAMVWKSENIDAPDIAAYDSAHPQTPGVDAAAR
jgi:hypothetical protein